MITLITGTPGSGKTLYAVSKILEYVEQNKRLLEKGKEPRMIYANIDGLSIEGVEQAPEDWRNTPDGSIIFYDEIQQLEPYKKSRFDNQICDDLQIHRHTGHDIYGITQFPVLLHSNFKAVVGIHQHLHRGWGLSSATVFNWAYCVDAPNAPSNKKLAEHTFRFNYPKEIYKYYKSATLHTHKARVPKKIFLGVVVLLGMSYLAYKLLFQENNFFKKIYGVKDEKQNTIKEQKENVVPTIGLKIAPTNQDKQTESVANQIEALNMQIQLIQLESQMQSLKKQSEEQQKRLNMPVSVVMFGKKCTAYNQHGLPMDLTFSECRLYAIGEKHTLIQTSINAVQQVNSNVAIQE